MFYLVDVYDRLDGIWWNLLESSDIVMVRSTWDKLIEKGKTCRVREVRDLNHGREWIG